jgi:K+-transporting ATPase KdpF subunit
MKHKPPKFAHILFWGLLLNAVIAPSVYAAVDHAITRGTAYAMGILGLIVLGLAIYLTLVIIHPEKF